MKESDDGRVRRSLEVQHVRRAFPRPAGAELLVLDDVQLTLREGEIVGLLGRSGSGKSTLLRIISGLSQPTAGSVTYLGQRWMARRAASPWCSRASRCFPWLTVLENVQLGLEALGLAGRRKSASARLPPSI